MPKGSDLLVRALENEGVERVFGVPGEENLDVVEKCESWDLTNRTVSDRVLSGVAGVPARRWLSAW
jgi:thiamine pyrophosphate-dependent acetolactate synthase large subunit-like protein